MQIAQALHSPEVHLSTPAQVAAKKTAHTVAMAYRENNLQKEAGKTAGPVPAPAPVRDESGAGCPAAASPSGQETTATPAAEDLPQQPASTAAVADPDMQGGPLPALANSVTAELRPVRLRAATTAISSGPKLPRTAQIPFFAPPAPVPVPLPAPKFKDAGGAGSQERLATAARTEDSPQPERAQADDAALEVRLKAPVQETNPKITAATTDPAAALPVSFEPVALKPLSEPPPSPILSASPVQVVTAEVTVRPPETPAHAAPHSAPSSARSTDIEEPVTPTDTHQPLRSVSLEFSPDGAGDVRLRLSEKSGEIHISLHSSDASLTSRLHEGVHDLVGSLSSAGYEAEAWTRGQGQQNSQREPEQRKNRRADSKDSGEAFGDVFQQPTQEIA